MPSDQGCWRVLQTSKAKDSTLSLQEKCAHLSMQIAVSESVGDSSLYPSNQNSGLYCSAEQQHVVWCEISAPSKPLQPVALWNISRRGKAMQAQSAAISSQPLVLSYAAKHGTPALIKHSLEITTGRNNYSLTLTLMICMWTSWCLLCVHVCLLRQYKLQSYSWELLQWEVDIFEF